MSVKVHLDIVSFAMELDDDAGLLLGDMPLPTSSGETWSGTTSARSSDGEPRLPRVGTPVPTRGARALLQSGLRRTIRVDDVDGGGGRCTTKHDTQNECIRTPRMTSAPPPRDAPSSSCSPPPRRVRRWSMARLKRRVGGLWFGFRRVDR